MKKREQYPRQNILILYATEEIRKDYVAFHDLNKKFGDTDAGSSFLVLAHSEKGLRITLDTTNVDYKTHVKLHESNSYTLIFVHAGDTKAKRHFPSVQTVPYTKNILGWYGKAFENIERAKSTGDKDRFIEVVVEEFSKLTIRKDLEQLADDFLTLLSRRFEIVFPDYIGKNREEWKKLLVKDLEDQNIASDVSLADSRVWLNCSNSVLNDFLRLFVTAPDDANPRAVAKPHLHGTEEDPFPELIGTSPEFMSFKQRLAQFSLSNVTILMLGERGTGKSFVARMIHEKSGRRGRYCKPELRGIPAGLVDDRLFGHYRGAFAEAKNDALGCFEQAKNGTVFLDEIGNLPVETQEKLLNVIQDRVVQRLGNPPKGAAPDIPVDFRLVVATNENLISKIGDGTFRKDLFDRLNVGMILIPPLRRHKNDIPLLATHFLKGNPENTEGIMEFSKSATDELMNHDWPGNIRELENTIASTLVLSKLPESGIVVDGVVRRIEWPPVYDPDEKDGYQNADGVPAGRKKNVQNNALRPVTDWKRQKCEEECKKYARYLADGRTLAGAQEEYNKANPDKPLKGKNGNSFGAKVRALCQTCRKNGYSDLLEKFSRIARYGK